MLLTSEENYLKNIYLQVSKEGSKVSVTLLANALGNNPASVIEMLKKLTDKNLILYDKTNGARLTESGKTAALQTIRRHRLWEMFLQEKLGYSWDEVHDIAEQLEHVQDEYLANRLDQFLNYPPFDPHGEAIPTENGQMPKQQSLTLKEIASGSSCLVTSVKDTSKSFLQYLRRLKIGIGTQIQVLERIDFDGSLIIEIDQAEKVTISEKFAEGIFVELLN